MPIVPSPTAQVYDPAWSILNAARARLAHLMPSLYPYSGNVLGYTQAGTQQMFNNAYRRFQDAMCDAGSKKFQGDVIVTDIPATTNYDPAVQNSISWFQCFDGNNYTTTPVLPSDLVIPLWMSERQAGTAFNFPWPDTPNMDMYLDGLPMQQKYAFNGCWEWRGDVIYYPGATQSVDFRIRYRYNLPDIVDVGTQRWFQADVPMVRCQDPLSWWLVVEVATAEASKPDASGKVIAMAQSAQQQAMEATKKYVNRDVMLDERTEARRVGYGAASRGNNGWNGGYGGW